MSATQKQTIIQLLNAAEWVCGTEFQQRYIPEYRTRINEIRKDGFTVEARRCTQHQHKGIMQEWSLRPKDDKSTVKEESPRSEAPTHSQAIPRNYAYYPPPEPTFCCPIAKVSNGRMHTRACVANKEKI